MRRMRQCGRAVALWCLCLYAVAQAGLFAVMDRWHPMQFERVYRHKWRQLRRLTARAPGRPLVVMLGSSRTDGAFEAGRLSGTPGPDGRTLLAYNFGVPAAGPIHEYLYLREMLDAGIRPRLLLVEFLPPLLNEPHKALISEERWTSAPWISLSQLVRMRPYFACPGLKTREWVEARLAPWCVYRPHFHERLQEALDPPAEPRPRRCQDAWGHRIPEPLPPGDSAYQLGAWRRAACRDMYGETLARLRVGDGPRRALHDLLDHCRRENIPVALVVMPESNDFRSWYRPEGLAAARRLLDELSAAYGAEVIDANRWIDDADFSDGHHVLARGAEVFTTRLLGEVRRILARTGQADGPAPTP
jgi:hypothetical protein